MIKNNKSQLILSVGIFLKLQRKFEINSPNHNEKKSLENEEWLTRGDWLTRRNGFKLSTMIKFCNNFVPSLLCQKYRSSHQKYEYYFTLQYQKFNKLFFLQIYNFYKYLKLIHVDSFSFKEKICKVTLFSLWSISFLIWYTIVSY